MVRLKTSHLMQQLLYVKCNKGSLVISQRTLILHRSSWNKPAPKHLTMVDFFYYSDPIRSLLTATPHQPHVEDLLYSDIRIRSLSFSVIDIFYLKK